MSGGVSLAEYTYPLPEDRVARYPLPERDRARLLWYREGEVRHHRFYELPELLPAHTTLVINTTRVVPARLFFRKPTGALIEVFCLEPESASVPIEQALSARGSARWKCKVRNIRRWRGGLERNEGGRRLRARLVRREGADAVVHFEWEPAEASFAEVLEVFGKVPLPPYLGRDDEPSDRAWYQTVFAEHPGAVAAPTASLHFSEALMAKVKQRFPVVEVTLHVGAGTFQPIRGEDVAAHPMHAEQVVVSAEAVRRLAESDHITAVGTTAVRTLESLYWYALKVMERGGLPPFRMGRFPYREGDDPAVSFAELMGRLARRMEEEGVDEIRGLTRLFIVPPYRFRAVDALVTNFHLPRSTLLLLVDAFVGGKWRVIYEAALREGYRFLSYGDASLLFRSSGQPPKSR